MNKIIERPTFGEDVHVIFVMCNLMQYVDIFTKDLFRGGRSNVAQYCLSNTLIQSNKISIVTNLYP
jgi:hypothetical protein